MDETEHFKPIARKLVDSLNAEQSLDLKATLLAEMFEISKILKSMPESGLVLDEKWES